jgi:hypothetical protein
MPRKRTVRKRIARARATRRKSGGEAAPLAIQAQENEQKKKNANAQNDAAQDKMKDELRRLEREMAQISMNDLEANKQKIKKYQSVYISSMTDKIDKIKNSPIRDYYEVIFKNKLQDEQFTAKRIYGTRYIIEIPELEGMEKLLSDMEKWEPMKRSWFGPSDKELKSMRMQMTSSIKDRFNEFIKDFKIIAKYDTSISEIDKKILYAKETSERIKEIKMKLGLL